MDPMTYQGSPYTDTEKWAHTLITGPSLIFGVMWVCLLTYRQRDYYHFANQVVLVICSTVYHSSRGFGMATFMNIEFKQWHKLDNITSGLCLSAMVLQAFPQQINVNGKFSQIPHTPTRVLLNSLVLWTIIITQEFTGTSLTLTLIPLLCITIPAYIYLVRTEGMPKYNKRNLMIGYLLAGVGVIFYFLSQNMDEDYLQWKHGVWHFLISFGSFFIWQAQYFGNDSYSLKDALFGKKKKDNKSMVINDEIYQVEI